MSEGYESISSGERNNFIVLIIVMIGVVLVVALVRPFIFEYIVPIVMGEGQSSTTIQEEEVPPDEVAPPANEAPETTTEEVEESSPTEEDSQTPGESMTETGVLEEVSESTEGETQTVSEETRGSEETVTEAEVTPETPSSISHIVKTGETLTTIAEQYNVSIDAIVQMNALPNANRIKIGDTLKIPSSDSD